MLGTLCRITERYDAAPAGKNTLALHCDLNTNDSFAVRVNLPVRLSIQLGSRQQLRCYAKSIRTIQAAELPTASAVLSLRATICIPQVATPSAQQQLVIIHHSQICALLVQSITTKPFTQH